MVFTRTLSELLADKGNSSEWRRAWSDLDSTNICKLSGGEGVKTPIECDFGHKRDAGILILYHGNTMRSDRRAPGSFSYGAFFDARFR